MLFYYIFLERHIVIYWVTPLIYSESFPIVSTNVFEYVLDNQVINFLKIY